MLIGFHGGYLQHKQVWIPLYEYMKEHGYNVTLDFRQALSDGCVLSSSGVFKGSKTMYFQHGITQGEGFPPESFGVLVPGPFWLANFSKLHPLPKGRIRMVGWPKSDLLFHPDRDRVKSEVETKLNLPYEKTVLLATGIHDSLSRDEWYTHSTGLPKHKGFVNHVKGLIETTARLKVNLVIKPHSLEAHEFKRPHVRWIKTTENPDITKLFLISDVVVAGHTSVPTEAMVADIPIVMYETGHFLAGFPFSDREYPALKGSWNVMENNIKRSLEQPNEFQQLRKKWVEKNIFKPDGNASKRAAEAIMELLQVPSQK